MMTLQQRIEVPADRRVIIDVPKEIPEGTTSIIITFIDVDDKASVRRRHAREDLALSMERQAQMERETSLKLAECRISASLLAMRGSCKGLDTMDAYFARKQADKEKEQSQERWHS